MSDNSTGSLQNKLAGSVLDQRRGVNYAQPFLARAYTGHFVPLGSFGAIKSEAGGIIGGVKLNFLTTTFMISFALAICLCGPVDWREKEFARLLSVMPGYKRNNPKGRVGRRPAEAGVGI